MPYKIIIIACTLISLFFAYANVRMQGIAMPFSGPDQLKESLILSLKDQKSLIFEKPILAPISFWYELALFSKKMKEPVHMKDIINIKNNGITKNFLPYYTDKNRIAVVQIFGKTTDMHWCAIWQIPRKGGDYAIFPFAPECAQNEENITEIRIGFLKATSLSEKYNFIRKDMESFYTILRRVVFLDIIP